MYKEILKWLVALITKPKKAWEVLARKELDKEAFLKRFLYPLLGLIAVAAFIGILLNRTKFGFDIALRTTLRMFLSYFGGFYASVYVMNSVWQRFFQRQKDQVLWMHFIGYSSSLMFVLNIVLTLLTEFFFLKIFMFYTLFIVWEGADVYMGVKEEERMKFVLITSSVIILMPVLVEKCLFIFFPGLR